MGGQRPYSGRYGDSDPMGDMEPMGGQRPYRGHYGGTARPYRGRYGDSDPMGDVMGTTTL